MRTIEIENKYGKVKLNEVVTRDSIGRMIDEIGKLFGASAAQNGANFGEIMNCAENAIDMLDIEINSPGGSVFDGYTIYQEIKSLQDRGVVVNCTITGLAASMASVIAMACDKVGIVPHGRMMIHDASNVVQGNSEQLKRAAELLDSISDDIAGIYAGKTKKDKEYIRELMKKETWMNAQEAYENGFVDEVVDIRTKDAKKKPMNLLKGFLNKLSAEEKEELQASLAEVDSLSNQLVEAEAKIKELSELSAVVLEKEAKIQELQEIANRVPELEAKLKTQEEQVATATVEALAAIGQPEALEIENGEQKSILEQFESLKGSEATAFFKENRKAIKAELNKKK